MAFITESYLKTYYLDHDYDKPLCVPKGVKFTPSAWDYVQVRHITILEQDVPEEHESSHNENIKFAKPYNKEEWETPSSYKNHYTGEVMDEKPETMTHLFENELVYKDDPRIVLRGRLDTLQSQILEFQKECDKDRRDDLVDSLGDLLDYTRKILGYEVLNQEIPDIKVLGLSMDELRDKSHHPEKYFGLKQMVLLNHQMDEHILRLNRLRAESREIELVAVSTFKKDNSFVRSDIVKALNRLSSAFHILMYQELSKHN